MNPYLRVAKHAGLKQTSALLDSLRQLGGDSHEIVATLRRHGLAGLVLSNAPQRDLRAALPAAAVADLETWQARPRPSNRALLAGFEMARSALAKEGVPALLLKGCYFAERLYGGIECRPQFDVDMLVQDRDFRRAVRLLVHAGFARHTYDLHSRTLVVNGWKLDLHRCLRRAPAFRLDERTVWDSAIEARVDGIAFKTLSDQWHLVLLVLGAFEDLGQGMAKLRQLLDLYLFARDVDANFPWDDFFRYRALENLSGVAATVLALVVKLFDAQLELPRLAGALVAWRGQACDTTEAEAIGLVFAARKRPENFSWFARIYPGSHRLYLAEFWLAGFPQNLRELSAGRLTSSLRMALGGGSNSGARV